MNDPASQLVAERLRERQLRLVLAESCTAGLVAAKLGEIPGISEWLCGSAVVYRLETKHQWLGVPRELFQPTGPGVVSREVAEAMALGALAHTPEADIAAAITGHFGPNAPTELDGLIWMAVAKRGEEVLAVSHRLSNAGWSNLGVRVTRQCKATVNLLELIAESLT